MSFKLSAATTAVVIPKKATKTHFMLTGFKQDLEFRVFTFEASPASGNKTPFVVRADLSLARRYGIPMQALPLLCREILERNENSDLRSFIYSEEEMCRYARQCKEERTALALKKQSARRSVTTSQPGVGWRTPVPQTNG